MVINFKSIHNFILNNFRIFLFTTVITFIIALILFNYDEIKYDAELNIQLYEDDNFIDDNRLKTDFRFNLQGELHKLFTFQNIFDSSNTKKFYSDVEGREPANIKFTNYKVKFFEFDNRNEAKDTLNDILEKINIELTNSYNNQYLESIKKEIFNREIKIENAQSEINKTELNFSYDVKALINQLEEVSELIKLFDEKKINDKFYKEDMFLSSPANVLSRNTVIKNYFNEGYDVINKKLDQARKYDLDRLREINSEYRFAIFEVENQKKDIIRLKGYLSNSEEIFLEKDLLSGKNINLAIKETKNFTPKLLIVISFFAIIFVSMILSMLKMGIRIEE